MRTSVALSAVVALAAATRLFSAVAVPAATYAAGTAGEENGSPAAKDTAGHKLADVWRKVSTRHPGAYLAAITGRTDARGVVTCDPRDPSMDGWRYHFYSPRDSRRVVISRCGDAVTEPFVELHAHAREAAPGPIEGDFIDSDEVLTVLAKRGVSLDPADYGTGGKHPFGLDLRNPKDPRFKDHPVFWEVRIGDSEFKVNAETEEMLHRSGAAAEAPAGSAGIPAALKRRARIRHPGAYTAKADWEKVRAYAGANLPRSRLYAAGGLTDAWGTAACWGAGDGWTFYYYNPTTRSFDAVVACKGEVGPGPVGNVPANLGTHEAVAEEFIDSDRAFDLVLADEPNAMDEGLGREFSRRAVARLLEYKAPPFLDQGVDTKLFWELEVGGQTYYVDAARAVYIGAKAR